MSNSTEHKQQLPKQQGLVISYFGNSVAVEADDGQVFQCQLHRNQDLPVVGDRVWWQKEESNNCTIESILPRKSVLARGDARGKMKPMAANVDALLIVMAPPPIFSERLIDRYLIAAELLNIEPVVIVNKDDLLTPPSREQVNHRLKAYQRVPYTTVLSSVITQAGLRDLKAYLHNKTAVLIGPSGVGKSSIIASLSQSAVIRIGEVSAKGSGKHTTTATRLYHLPEGGMLIDSPGVRDFTLWPIDQSDVLRGFKEFKPYLGQCKFRDCIHMAEPGCAIKAAVETDQISQERYQSYQHLLQASNHAK